VTDPPSPLIDASELIAGIDDPRLRLADVRWVLGSPAEGRRMYDAGHLPGAVFVDLEHDLSAREGPGRHPLPDPATFTRRMGELGLGTDDRVVVYDDAGGTVASRLWWMLDGLGHRDVRLLDGGIDAWLAAGGSLESANTSRPPTTMALATAWPRTLDRFAIAGRSDRQVLVDMRAPERWRGEVEPVDPVAGHIPGARNLPATSLLGPDKRLLAADDLRARFTTLADGAEDDGTELVLSCGSGVTACLGVLATRVAGLPDALLYPGSYSDWSRSGMPIESESTR
jgi:thiosulfate/3-mercaptopyruvate sulfurtransferase